MINGPDGNLVWTPGSSLVLPPRSGIRAAGLLEGAHRTADEPVEEIVVVADDDPNMLGDFANLIGDAAGGARLILKPDGAQALQAIMECLRLEEGVRQRISLIVSDEMVPGLRGDELYDKVRDIPALSTTPFVVVSGGVPNDATEEIRSAFARLIFMERSDHWLATFRKPVDGEDFQNKVRELRRRHQTLRDILRSVIRLH